MSTATVYKCTDNQVLDDFVAKREAATAEFNAKCDAYSAIIGGKTLTGTAFYDGGWTITGYQMGARNEDLPAGWRREQHSSNAVPAKRTAEGKEHARAMRELYLPGNVYPGVPNMLHCEGFAIFPRVAKIATVWWLTLSKVPYEKDLEAIDGTLWSTAKLSEYYAAKEAMEVTS